MIPTDRYYHSGPGDGDNSILTTLSVMPFCRGVASGTGHLDILVYTWTNKITQKRGIFFCAVQRVKCI